MKKADDNYDWYQKLFLGESSTAETLQIDGKEYQKIIVPSQSDAEWIKNTELGISLQEVLSSLFESHLVAAEISDSQAEEHEDNTHYILTMNDDYPERIKSENLDTLQQSIDELKDSNAEEGIIQAMEAQIQMIEETNYQDNVLTYVINKDGFLTSFILEAKVQPPEGEPFDLMNRFSLTEYNLNDTENLLPSIED